MIRHDSQLSMQYQYIKNIPIYKYTNIQVHKHTDIFCESIIHKEQDSLRRSLATTLYNRRDIEHE